MIGVDLLVVVISVVSRGIASVIATVVVGVLSPQVGFPVVRARAIPVLVLVGLVGLVMTFVEAGSTLSSMLKCPSTAGGTSGTKGLLRLTCSSCVLFDTTKLRFWGTTDINARFFMKGPHFDASWPFRFDGCVPFSSRYLHTERCILSTCISQWSYITRFGWYLQSSHIH